MLKRVKESLEEIITGGNYLSGDFKTEMSLIKMKSLSFRKNLWLKDFSELRSLSSFFLTPKQF